jgi:hypothetical protein
MKALITRWKKMAWQQRILLIFVCLGLYALALGFEVTLPKKSEQANPNLGERNR